MKRIPTGRQVTNELLVHLWFWVVCTGFVLLHLYYVSEAFARWNDIHFWHFIMMPFAALFYLHFLAWPMLGYLQRHLDFDCEVDCLRADTLFRSLQRLLWLGIGGICVVLCPIGFSAPFGEFQKMDQAEGAISRTKAPGFRAPINCTTDENPGSIDVRTDLYSYFVLADPQWSVAALNWTEVASEEGWSWVVAPILYNGPIEECQTEYPLFAVCIDKAVTSAQCSWDNERRGAVSTDMRLLTASHEIEPRKMEQFWGKWVTNPYNSSEKVKLVHENLFQFNSPSYDETVAFLEYKRKQLYTLQWKATVIWFSASVPVTLMVCLFYLWKVSNLPQPSATEPATCQEVPSTSTAAPHDALPYGVEDAEMSTAPSLC